MLRYPTLLLLCGLLPLAAADLPRLDFEQGADLAVYANLEVDRTAEASVVAPGADGTGRCLLLRNREVGKYATATLRGPIALQRNLAVAFDVKAVAEPPDMGNYIGVLAYVGPQQFFGQVAFSPAWQSAVLPLASLRPTNGGRLQAGLVFDRINVYGRAKDPGCRMSVWIDNLRLTTDPAPGRAGGRRTSLANPPLLDWSPDETATRLELSTDPQFGAASTHSWPLRWNWFTPPRPLAPGTWYWRTWRESELYAGWSDTGCVVVPAETHQFQPGPLPLEQLAAKPHPRLVDVAAERARLGSTGLAALVRTAEGLYRQGIADDCPVWVEGDPRWPTWIEWYGRAHGGITSAAGTRLERLGRAAAVTGDPQVIAWCRELALKAARWDPLGGSAYSRGDIGAHHFLRGLNNSYDALYPQLDEADRATIRAALVTRARQFWAALSPFRGGENNNHAWLKAFGLAESGFVLNGEEPDAARWAAYVYDLYLGRFLCTLGFQGDNNEGIAYWGYGLSFVISYGDLVRQVAGVDLFRHPWLAQTDRFPLYTAPPNSWAVSFADTGQPNHGSRGPAQTAHVRALAERVGDPYGLWYAGVREAVNGVEPRPPVDLPPSIHYRHIGWAVHHTNLLDGRDGVTLAMRSGPFYAGHQHEDLNSFVLHGYGEKLAIDGGHYDWFGSPHFSKWSVLTRAHNSILVDGRDQNSRRDGADGRIAAWFDSPVAGHTVGEIASPLVYDGRVEQFRRRLLFLKPGYVLVYDQLTARGGAARWDWLLHTVAAPTVDPATQAFRLTAGQASLAGRFLLPAKLGIAVSDHFPVEPVQGYSTNPVPSERYVPEWHLTATPANPSEREEFLTALQVTRGAPALQATRAPATGGLAVQLAGGEQSWRIVLRREDPEVHGLDLRTDAAAAAVARDARGALAAATWQDGRHLTDGQRPVWQSDRPCAGSLLRTAAGTRLDLAATEPLQASVPCPAAPAAVLLDGRPLAGRHVPASGLLHLNLPAGEHIIAFGTSPAELLDRPLPALDLAGAKLQGYAQRLAIGERATWWGRCDVPAPGRYQVMVGDVPGTLDNLVSTDPRGPWLEAGSHYVTVTAPGPRTTARLVGTPIAPEVAEQLPATWQPPAAALLVEAEQPVAEGPVKGRIVEKIGARGGVAHCNWDTPGQWAEWELTIPTAGAYHLLLRGCSETGPVLRELYLDGKPLRGVSGVVQLAATGGFARTTDDWRWFRLSRPLTLSAGRHRLKMEMLNGSWNVDAVGWLAAPNG
ncbi:MAG: DUF4962 domain-containing protein [Fimbriimonadaceae bacterium]|nr:DUF4962 domain-containing protein [Fimbriimonadaceae bacterium]